MADFYAPGFDQEVEQQNIERQRKMADLLRQQAMQPMENGQMVSGHYVAPSFTQGLAKLLQGYNAGKMNDAATEKQTALAQAVRGRNTSETGAITDAMSGTPAQFTLPEGQQGPQIDAQAPNTKLAASLAINSHNPTWQQWGMTQMMPKLPKWEKFDKPDGQGGHVSGFIDTNSPTPIATFQPGGAQPAKLEGVNTGGNTTFVNPYAPKMEGAPVVAATANPFKDEVVGDGQGGVVPNAPLVAVNKDIRAAGKPVFNVDARQINTQETEQSKKYGASLGEIRANINQAGWDAHKKLANLSRMEELLKGVDGGGAAPTLAKISSFANSMGIKLDPRLGPKQAAEALSREMAGSLRQPGTGPMTDKDFDNFLAQIPDLSKSAEGRAQITKTMRAAVERDQRAAQFARDYAQKNKGVIDDGYFDAIANFYAQNPVVTPNMPQTNQQGEPLQMPKGFTVIR